MISGAHRWETANTYLQDIYYIVKPWIQKNKSITQIKMCMCGEWMVYGDDGDNNGESLILLLLFLGDTYLSCSLNLFEENEMLYIFFFSLFFVSHVGIFVPLILLSDTCPFLPLVSLFLFFEVPGTCPFLFSRIFFFSSFFRAFISWNNVASSSNQNN